MIPSRPLELETAPHVTGAREFVPNGNGAPNASQVEEDLFRDHDRIERLTASWSSRANVRKVGPDLTHIASQKTPIGGVAGLDVNEADLIKWVSNAPSLKPGVVMPVFSTKVGGPLDDATILAIVKFLETLK